MSLKLWVAYETPAKSFIDNVSIEGCDDVDDFKEEIKKKFEISGPSCDLSLFQSDGNTEIDVGASPSLLVDGKSRKNPFIVRSTLLEKEELAIGSSKQFEVVQLHIYALRATKEFQTVSVEIISGKIHVKSLLEMMRWKMLYYFEPTVLLRYDNDGWSFDEFISGNVYKFLYEIDDEYDESIGFSEAKIETVVEHFNLIFYSCFASYESEYPFAKIPQPFFKQLVLLLKRNSRFSKNARRTLISLFLANAIEYADEEGKLLVTEKMSLTCVVEDFGKRIRYTGPVDFAIGNSSVDTRLIRDCALLVVEDKIDAKSENTTGQVAAQAATNFIIRKKEGGGENGNLKVYWCVSDGEYWTFGFVTDGKGGKLIVEQANSRTCWFHQRHMIPNEEECSKLFSFIVFWVKEAMQSSRTTSRRNSERVDGFELDNVDSRFASASFK